jgi:hypothetical protein
VRSASTMPALGVRVRVAALTLVGRDSLTALAY